MGMGAVYAGADFGGGGAFGPLAHLDHHSHFHDEARALTSGPYCFGSQRSSLHEDQSSSPAPLCPACVDPDGQGADALSWILQGRLFIVWSS